MMHHKHQAALWLLHDPQAGVPAKRTLHCDRHRPLFDPIWSTPATTTRGCRAIAIQAACRSPIMPSTACTWPGSNGWICQLHSQLPACKATIPAPPPLRSRDGACAEDHRQGRKQRQETSLRPMAQLPCLCLPGALGPPTQKASFRLYGLAHPEA